MGDHCTIEWVVALARQLNAVPASLNPIRGCSRQSDACRSCYAAGIAYRFGHKGNGVYAGLTDLDPAGIPRFNGVLRWVPEVLTTAIHAKRSRVYFVCDMSDLFHARVEQAWIDQVFATMALCRHHLFLLLTKRPERMKSYLTDPETPRRVAVQIDVLGGMSDRAAGLLDRLPDTTDVSGDKPSSWWPLSNVWTGATVEDQAAANERIPHLLATPAAVRFLSMEPLLGPVNLSAIDISGDEEILPLGAAWLDRLEEGETEGPRLDWVITGGESGPNARPSHPDWFRSIRDQCAKARVPHLFKQWGSWGLYGPRDKNGALKPVEAFALANDGTLYRATDLAYPDGPRRGEAIRANHDKAALHTVYRVGKKAAGRELDDRTHDEMPPVHFVAEAARIGTQSSATTSVSG